jgi:hypothetical protein
MSKKFSISVDHNALRQFPFLDRLQKQQFPISTLNEVMYVLENRPEGFKIELVYSVLKVSLINVNRDTNDDYLGLPKIEGQLKDLCDVIRETTSYGTRGGVDPRTQIYYSRKSSILQGSNLSDDALIAPNYVSNRGLRKRHPLDLVSTEEVVKRRELANRHWQEQKKEQRRKQQSSINSKIRNAQDFLTRSNFDKKQ